MSTKERIKSASKLEAIAFCAFSVSTGYCRLDETIDQIAVRYGQETPGKPGNNSPADTVKAYYFRGKPLVEFCERGGKSRVGRRSLRFNCALEDAGLSI
jgi:hypothetical protein